MKKILLLLLTIMVSQLSSAQGRQGPEKIRALKVAQITESLDLTPTEAQAFWPVYNKYESKMEAIRRDERTTLRTLRKNGIDGLSQEEANELLDKLINFRSSEVAIHREQIEALKSVIDPLKILRLQKAEEDFKRMLLKQYRGKRGGR